MFMGILLDRLFLCQVASTGKRSTETKTRKS
jgi:hypothetical protein